jgi:hypothetical protein
MLERNKPTSDDSLFLIMLIIYNNITYGLHLVNQPKSNTEEMSNFIPRARPGIDSRDHLLTISPSGTNRQALQCDHSYTWRYTVDTWILGYLNTFDTLLPVRCWILDSELRMKLCTKLCRILNLAPYPWFPLSSKLDS